MNARESAALDNYITGHYGEDQFRGEADYEEFVDEVCGKCPDYIQKHCPSNTGENVVCLYILDALEKSENADNPLIEYPEICMCCDEDHKNCTKDPSECEKEAWSDYVECYYESMRER
jgi:hypothetical protein